MKMFIIATLAALTMSSFATYSHADCSKNYNNCPHHSR
jgi:hypothetical protein